jgi:hypothetical protein
VTSEQADELVRPAGRPERAVGERVVERDDERPAVGASEDSLESEGFSSDRTGH